MVRSSFVVVVAATLAAGTFFAQSVRAQEESDQRLGNVHFETSCNEAGAATLRPRHALPALVLVQRRQGDLRGGAKADPECGIAYWGVALSLLNNPHNPSPRANLPLGLAAIQKAKAVGAKTERERDYIDALSLMYADYDKVDRTPSACRAYLKAMERARRRNIPTTTRRRSPTPSRSTSRPRRPTRPMPSSSRARRSWSRFQAPAAASRRRALPDPSLRLPGDRGEGPRCRQALFQDRAGRAARAAHAVAHLHARRLLEGVDRRPTSPR